MNKSLELILKAVRRNRHDLLVGFGASVAAILAGKLIADESKKQEEQKKEEEKRDTTIKDFRTAAENYMEAVNDGTPDLASVRRMIACTDQLNVYVSNHRQPYSPSMVKMETLMNTVYISTEKMISQSGLAGIRLEKPDTSSDLNAIRCLREYLTIQKYVLEKNE